MKISLPVVLVVAALSGLVGVVAGYFFAQKNLTSAEFKQELAQEEQQQQALDSALKGAPGPENAAAPSPPADFTGGSATFAVHSNGMSRVSFTSDAPLETIVGTTAKVSGKLIVDLGDVTRTQARDIEVAVGTLKTGVDLRDEHLQGETWFDTENHPHATFVLERVQADQRRLWLGHKLEATLEGRLTIKGITKPVKASATIGYHAHNADLDKFGVTGNVLRIKAAFSVRLSEYDMSPPLIGTKVAEVVDVALNLTAIEQQAGD